jgi:hypothetical protein
MCEHADASDSSKALTPTPSAACTNACTSEMERANADALDVPEQKKSTGAETPTAPADRLALLAAELAKLSPADRERLAAMLTRR